MCYLAAAASKVTRPAIYEARAPLGRLGAPYGQYLLDDVLAGRVRPKLFVFLNAWRLSADQRARLAQVTAGCDSLWCYAPGYFDGDRVSLDAMAQVTGFRLKTVAMEKAWVTPTDAGRKLGLEHGFGAEGTIRPLLAVTSAEPGEVLGTYPDGSTAVALRRRPEGASIFVAVPRLSSELLRVAAREAGVHLFTQTDCNIYANGPILALHASRDGPLEVDTGKPGGVADALTGEVIGAGPKFTLSLKRGDTRVFKY